MFRIDLEVHVAVTNKIIERNVWRQYGHLEKMKNQPQQIKVEEEKEARDVEKEEDEK